MLNISGRFYFYIALEVVLISIVLGCTYYNIDMISLFILVMSPFFLLFSAIWLEVNERKNPLLLLGSIILYIVIVLTSYLMTLHIGTEKYLSKTSHFNEGSMVTFIISIVTKEMLIGVSVYLVLLYFFKKNDNKTTTE